MTSVAAPVARSDRTRRLQRFVRSEPVGVVSFVVIVVIVVVAVLAPVVAPYSPIAQFRDAILQPPSPQFWLGTDPLGRDVLSRVIFGARTSLVIAVATTILGGMIGIAVGLVSGYAGRATDLVIQRVSDAIESVPPIVLLLVLASILGPSIPNTIFALMIIVIPGFNRVARGEVIRLKQERYVEAARSLGARPARIVFRHILPNMIGPIMTVATLRLASIIVAESALSFLGLGAPPPTPSWGAMISEGVQYMSFAPWLIVVPAIALSISVLAFNLFGDALRDFLDPRLTRR